jgi:hypothetical protein
MGLIQLLKEQTRLDVVGRKPDADKVTRMSRQQGRFEAGRILLPSEAGWPISKASSSPSPVAATTTRSTHCCCSWSGSPSMSSIFTSHRLPGGDRPANRALAVAGRPLAFLV